MPRPHPVALLCLLTAPLLADPPQPAAAAPAPAPEQHSPLAGPAVNERGAAESRAVDRLAARADEDGIRPEEAALDELGLPVADLVAARTIIDDRAVAMDRVLRENTDTVVQIEPAMQAGQKAKGITLILKLAAEFREADGQSPLVDRVAQALPESARERYRSLVAQAFDRLIHRAIERDGDTVQKGVLGGIQRGVVGAGVRAGLLFKEAERSGARVFDEAAAMQRHAEAFLAKIELPEPQEAQVREIFHDWAATVSGEPTRQQLADLMLKIYDSLEEPHRRTFFSNVLTMQD